MRKALQIILRIIFLALFIFLTVIEKIQLWLAILVFGLLLSIFFSRLYCGWTCPINTLMCSASWIKRKLHIGNLTIPAFLKKPAIRAIILGLFVTLFVFTTVSGKKLPILPGLLILGVTLTLFFPEELWHRYICPYGTIFSIVARKPFFRPSIDKGACIQCGVCARVCPASAVSTLSGSYVIQENECLSCFTCSDQCKHNAIQYRGRQCNPAQVQKNEKGEAV